MGHHAQSRPPAVHRPSSVGAADEKLEGPHREKIGLGSIWQKGYRDTMIRDGDHFANAVRYIRKKPAKLRHSTFTLWQSERALAVK
jgi:methionine salvage enolase-phosphatase E1